jgi:tetratricopeptide (TPR) repeat protein
MTARIQADETADRMVETNESVRASMNTSMTMNFEPTAGRGGRRPRAVALFLAAGVCLLVATAAQPARGQALDRVTIFGGAGLSGRVVDVSPLMVEVETSDGATQKVAIETVRDVQFGAEPQALKNARSMLLRGRGADAANEVAKIQPDEIEGAESLVLAELDFVRAAAAGRAALDAGGDLAGAADTVAAYLGKHPKSHHFFLMQELLGDLHARAGRPEDAVAAYKKLEDGPPALKVRAATAKASMLLAQEKADEAIAEFDVAIGLAGNEKTNLQQKLAAQLGKARCLTLQGKHDDSIGMVLQIIKAANPEEKELLSRAYNVLGTAYRAMGGKDQDALIQFLTVDLVYNTLPETHAEALFNLGELWEKGNKPERAGEARQSLKTLYATSPWAAKLEAGK